ncbi:hypothetical protein [Nocardia sp. NPDC050718]|uniref:hypothetical protein n=1 Tax=Nocardia sp. NPDC050718 TaxID=3155788 RepID=UPI0033FC1375
MRAAGFLRGGLLAGMVFAALSVAGVAAADDHTPTIALVTAFGPSLSPPIVDAIVPIVPEPGRTEDATAEDIPPSELGPPVSGPALDQILPVGPSPIEPILSLLNTFGIAIPHQADPDQPAPGADSSEPAAEAQSPEPSTESGPGPGYAEPASKDGPPRPRARTEPADPPAGGDSADPTIEGAPAESTVGAGPAGVAEGVAVESAAGAGAGQPIGAELSIAGCRTLPTREDGTATGAGPSGSTVRDGPAESARDAGVARAGIEGGSRPLAVDGRLGQLPIGAGGPVCLGAIDSGRIGFGGIERGQVGVDAIDLGPGGLWKIPAQVGPSVSGVPLPWVDRGDLVAGVHRLFPGIRAEPAISRADGRHRRHVNWAEGRAPDDNPTHHRETPLTLHGPGYLGGARAGPGPPAGSERVESAAVEPAAVVSTTVETLGAAPPT